MLRNNLGIFRSPGGSVRFANAGAATGQRGSPGRYVGEALFPLTLEIGTAR